MSITRRTALTLCAAACARSARASDTTIEISSIWGGDKPFQKIVDAYNARGTGVFVKNRFDGSYEDTARKTLAGKLAGKPPALMTTGWKFLQFARRTLGARDLREIDAAKAETMISAFVPSVREMARYDGALLGMPWALSTPITYIDLGLWTDAGLDPKLPADFDATWLTEQARTIHARLSGKHKTYRSAIDFSNNEWTSQAFIQNAGGEIINADGAITVASQAAAAGMRAYAAPARAGLWVPLGPNEQISAFDAGALAITTTSSGAAPSFAAQGHRPVISARFPAMPGRPRRMNSGGNFLAVYAREKEQADAALDFLLFCASPEGQALWSKVGYLNTSVYDIALVTPLHAPAVAQLRDGLTRETIWPGKRGLQGQDVWKKWVDRMLTTDVAIDQALAAARDEMTPILTG